jgi:hypothetical protein
MKPLYPPPDTKCFGTDRTIAAISCYDYCMSNPIQGLAACLLLMLLPLQAFAGAVAAPDKAAKAPPAPRAKPAMSALLPNAVRPLPKIFRTVSIDPALIAPKSKNAAV